MKGIKVYPVTIRMHCPSGWGKGVYWLLVTGYSLLLFITACQKGGETQVGKPAPDFHLKDIKGGEMTMGGLKGKVVLLRFWSTRCPSCKEEMPGLEKGYKSLKDKGLEILAVNVEDSREVASNFAKEMGLTYPILLDEEQRVAGLYNVYGIPTSFFIDKEGIIKERVFGDMKEEAIKRVVLPLLEGKAIPKGDAQGLHEHKH